MNKYIKIILSITIISGICGVILAFTYNKTKEKIAYEDRLDFLNSLKIILPQYDNSPDEEIINIDNHKIYVASKDGKVVGYAIAWTSNKGYGGIIEVLVGVDIYGKIYGVSVLKHKETPGLGDKIIKQDFLKLFTSLSDYSKISVKKDGGIIDEFSGATMSPRAVSDAVRNGLKFIQDNLISGENNGIK